MAAQRLPLEGEEGEAAAGFLQDPEDQDVREMLIPEESLMLRAKKAVPSVIGKSAIVLVLAAAVVLLVVVSVPSSPAVSSLKPAAGASKVGDAVGLYTVDCPACGYQCQCDWASQPGACENYDQTQCCWGCCCHQGVSDSFDSYSYGAGAFNCGSALSHWWYEWSYEKKDWCCRNEGLGCGGFFQWIADLWVANWGWFIFWGIVIAAIAVLVITYIRSVRRNVSMMDEITDDVFGKDKKDRSCCSCTGER